MDVPESHLTERQGILAVGRIFTDGMGWLFREQPTSDFGIDAHVEAVISGQTSGRLLGLQVKSGPSYLRETKGNGYVYRGDNRHLRYWLSHSLPVLLVLFDPEHNRAYWQHVTTDRVQEHRAGWSIEVPFEQVLDESARRDLIALSEGDPFMLWMRRLQVERGWMDLLRAGDRLLLEVEEWINKSSGRGDFRLLAQSPDGKERMERVWPYRIFPGMPYEELLPRLFDWADVSVDEGFYSYYEEDRYEAETGIWDSEEGRYILTESYEDWEATQPSGLRPYEEDGEIARWRVELTLNDIGRAFLTLSDEFGEHGD